MVKFTPQEAILALSGIVSYADGKKDKTELDLYHALLKYENISDFVCGSYLAKWQALGPYSEIFKMAIEALEDCSENIRTRACAWMWYTAVISDSKNGGTIDHSTVGSYDTWSQGQLGSVSKEEDEWIDKAILELRVSIDELNKQFLKLPKINVL